MTDQDLEQQLRQHFGAIDPVTAPPGLASRIDRALDQETASSPRSLGLRRAVITVLAAAAVVAIALAIRFGGLSAPVGESSSPSSPASSPTPTAAAPSATTGAMEPSGTYPPVSTAPWSGVDVQALPEGPLGVAQVVAWSRGYFALGVSDGIAELPAWVSRDGRQWIALPAGTFGRPSEVFAAASDTLVVVVALDASGAPTSFTSTDGLKWSSHVGAQIHALAGNSGGVLAIAGSGRGVLAYSRDGVTWQTIELPVGVGGSFTDIASFGPGFVAVVDPPSPADSPEAWLSTDGIRWTRSQVETLAGDGFNKVVAGANGLVALSTQPGYVPGRTSFWTSTDGQQFALSTADPLGVVTDGEGAGSANGLFTGDGTRLLAHGVRSSSAQYEYWTSLDGTNWGRLTLTGETTTVDTGQVTPFLLRDGILWSGDQGAWFGTATP